MAWTLLMYETASGQPVVERFLENLQLSTKQKVARQFKLLEEYGPELGMPHSKAVGKSLYELRIRGRQEVRIFYIFALEDRIYLLHCFQKKSQATPKHELSLARRRQQEIIDTL
jgi:phage-related protein